MGRREANERVEGRCNAIVKYIYGWRCTRRAVVDGVCLQHSRVPCRVPEGWVHERNKHDVLVPKAVGDVRVRRP